MNPIELHVRYKGAVEVRYRFIAENVRYAPYFNCTFVNEINYNGIYFYDKHEGFTSASNKFF